MKSFKLFTLSIASLLLVGCGKGNTHTHMYSSDWSYDSETHFHKCSGKDCTSKSEVASHTFDDANTCTVCGYKTTSSSNEGEQNNSEVARQEDNNNNNTNKNSNEEGTNSDNSNKENTSEDTPENNEENNNENNNSSEDTPVNTDEQEEVSYKINFYNPSCGSISKEVLDTRLKTYINEEAGTELVSTLKNSSCQVSNDIPTKGNKVLIIGAASTAGSLAFTFTKTVKKISITAQTYHKPYVETWNNNREVANVDPNSVLTITTDGASPVFLMDLKPGEDEKPVEKTMNIEITNTTLTLASATDENCRVFIKKITFVC